MGIQERFDTKYEIVEPGGCWVWMASLNNGYGQIGGQYAHRVSWEMHRGQIPDGICVLHSCDNPSCVNPAHLWLGTMGDNMLDRDLKGRQRTLHGEAHGSAKLTDIQVGTIRELASSKLQREIAAMFGVSQAQISNIVNGKSRRHNSAI